MQKIDITKESLRKTIHLAGLIFYFFKDWLPIENPIFWLLLLFFVNLTEILRSLKVIPFLNKLFSFALRERELENFSGAFYYFWGIGLSFLFFPLNSAFLALWILCLADGIAGLFGRGLFHSIVFFGISLSISALFLSDFNIALIFKALSWTIIERIKIIDDNLGVPLAVCLSFSI
jgi:dolichol kinase